jgi:hypothetical protein
MFSLPQASSDMSQVTLHEYTPGAARGPASPELAKGRQSFTSVV